MSSFFKRIFALSLEFVATSFFFAQEVQAQKTNIHQDTIGNIPSVSELSNVEISSWKFKFIEYFIQRYEIDIGYPLKTYLNIYQRQDNIKRAEFALIINKVIQHINQLQNNQKANFATEEELQTLTRLQSEFTSELDIVKDKIEQLEKNSFTTFSTTSTLRGESIFALTTVGKGKKIDDDEKNDSNFTLSNRIKIQLNTSFTGKDRLKTSFKTSNIKSLKSATGTDMARLTYQGDDDNKLELGDLTYRFPIGKKARVYIGAKGLNIKDFSNSVNPYLDGTGDGAVSRFGQRNPLFRQGGGARIGVKYEISDDLEFGMGYVADDADEPETGLSKSDYAAIAQLTLEPSKKFSVGLNYIHSYNNIDTNTGSERANDPFDDNSEAITGNSFGLQALIALNRNLLMGSWIGYTRAKANDLPDKPTAGILNWAVTFALPNLGKEGNLGGVVIGQPPKLIQNQYQSDNEEYIDKNTSLHLEAFYRFNVNNNIAITPGVVVITNPEHDKNNDTIFIGTLRTTFSF